jgi:hypothetical protein
LPYIPTKYSGGTNIERRPSFRQQAQKAQQQQAFQPSQSTITEVDYNTVSHEGLKSYQAQSSDAYSSPWINASNANLSFASGSTTITPEALPPNPDAAAGIADGGLGKVDFILCPPFRQYHHQQALRVGHLAHHRLSQMVGPQNGVNTSKNGISQTLQYKIDTKQ